MMPTFPRSSLSFRTAGFPQYGWKAGFPSGAFLDRQQLKPCSRHAPSVDQFASALRAPRSRSDCPALCRAADSIAHRLGGLLLLHPRGPRSGSGYSVPIRHHLIDPIRLARGHTAKPVRSRRFIPCRTVPGSSAAPFFPLGPTGEQTAQWLRSSSRPTG